MAKTNVIQGDLFNRGFPKFNETYYFFSIVPEKKADFTRALNTIGKTGKIATIDSVLKDWVKVDQSKTKTVEVSNALIAFSMEGLKMVMFGQSKICSTTNTPRLRMDWAGRMFYL